MTPHQLRHTLATQAINRGMSLEAIAALLGHKSMRMTMVKLEMHRRMLGNGYCPRPVGLDCHFESICESCTYFRTTHEFRPTIERQRDDAAEKGQVGRLKIFDGLLTRLEQSGIMSSRCPSPSCSRSRPTPTQTRRCRS